MNHALRVGIVASAHDEAQSAALRLKAAYPTVPAEEAEVIAYSQTTRCSVIAL